MAWPECGKQAWASNEDLMQKLGSQQESTATFAWDVGVAKQETGVCQEDCDPDEARKARQQGGSWSCGGGEWAWKHARVWWKWWEDSIRVTVGKFMVMMDCR